MKLHLIHPSVDTPATRRANQGVDIAARVLSSDTTLGVSHIAKGFESLESITRVAYNTPAIIDAAVQAERDGCDGIFINCVADPGVDAVREMVSVPVLGGFRGAMLAAMGCGERVAVIIPGTPSKAGSQLLDKVIAQNSIFASSIVCRGFTDLDVLELHNEDKLIARLVEFGGEAQRQGADCLFLGCTAMSYILPPLRGALASADVAIQVVEPLSAGLKLLETFVALGLSNSLKSQVSENRMEELFWYN